MRPAVADYRCWRCCRAACDRPGWPPIPERRPIPGWLLRILHGPRLADDRHLDLAGVGQLLLDLANDVAGEARRGEIVDLLRPHQDPDLAAGLDGKGTLDPGEAVGDRLEILEALHVRVHRLAAS